MKTRKIPLRKCIACGENKPKKQLIRIVKNKENEANVDLTGKANGRGAYICDSKECFDESVKTKKLERNLQVEIEDDVYDKLREVIKD